MPYDAHLRERVRTHLARHERRVVAPGDDRRAAVALVLVDSTQEDAELVATYPDGTEVERPFGLNEGLRTAAGGAAVLVCRRPLHLPRHAGQYSLPGGRLEPGEDVVAAALRETREEVGIDLGQDRVLGLLDDYVTRSGFVMTPVVVWGGPVTLRPDPGEVMIVYRVGLHQLDRPGSPWFTTIPESDRPVVALPLGSTVVHAPTAAVLVQLGWLGLHGRDDPVAHFEQPVFAWR
ncbi:CoA pyrophosphatase [Ornithinimicrobium avium]|uniref:CoA pyrophosphatase n=1 Tax=Ornithinimicrobium avium TaxID=2283195 RepID=A0A345NS65_9MICO|nr:CoA pyrophosphatase [Ornithinimicrobium avium]